MYFCDFQVSSCTMVAVTTRGESRTPLCTPTLTLESTTLAEKGSHSWTVSSVSLTPPPKACSTTSLWLLTGTYFTFMSSKVHEMVISWLNLFWISCRSWLTGAVADWEVVPLPPKKAYKKYTKYHRQTSYYVLNFTCSKNKKQVKNSSEILKLQLLRSGIKKLHSFSFLYIFCTISDCSACRLLCLHLVHPLKAQNCPWT